MVEVGHQHEVLLTGEELVDGRELPGDTDGSSHLIRLRHQVMTSDLHLAGVCANQGRQDLDHGGLARSIWTKQRKHGPLFNGQVDAVEHEIVSIGLAQTSYRDRRRR